MFFFSFSILYWKQQEKVMSNSAMTNDLRGCPKNMLQPEQHSFKNVLQKTMFF